MRSELLSTCIAAFLDSKPYVKPYEIFPDPGPLAREFITTAKLLSLFLERHL